MDLNIGASRVKQNTEIIRHININLIGKNTSKPNKKVEKNF